MSHQPEDPNGRPSVSGRSRSAQSWRSRAYETPALPARTKGSWYYPDGTLNRRLVALNSCAWAQFVILIGSLCPWSTSSGGMIRGLHSGGIITAPLAFVALFMLAFIVPGAMTNGAVWAIVPDNVATFTIAALNVQGINGFGACIVMLFSVIAVATAVTGARLPDKSKASPTPFA